MRVAGSPSSSFSLSPEQHVRAAPLPGENPVAAERGPGPSPFARLLHGLGREIDRGEHTVRHALHAGQRDLGPAELLALQAGVYRYSEAVDLAAKLVDRGTSGVKTVMSGS